MTEIASSCNERGQGKSVRLMEQPIGRTEGTGSLKRARGSTENGDQQEPKSILKRTSNVDSLVESGADSGESDAGEDNWDTDLDEGAPPTKPSVGASVNDTMLYIAACHRFGVVPMSAFARQLEDTHIQMNNQGMGPRDAMSIAVPLLRNHVCNILELSGNAVGLEGIQYLTEMMHDNVTISRMTLADNNLGSVGAKLVCDMLKYNGGLRFLDISGNGFQEKDAHYFVDALQQSFRLKDLNLSHNDFGIDGGIMLGKALSANDSLEKLNLSWNSLRLQGAVGIAKGLGDNMGLKLIDLSWNGFGSCGAKALGEALKKNKTLIELDASTNRVDQDGIIGLAKGAAENDTLEILRLSKNPITSAGAHVLLSYLKKNIDTVALKTLELYDVYVDKDFEEIEKELLQLKPTFRVGHGTYIQKQAEVYAKVRIEKREEKPLEPLEILINFVEKQNLNLMELFQQFDTDQSWSVSRDEFKQGMRMAKIPLNNFQMEKLLDVLDKDGDGEVDFGELMFESQEFETAKKERERLEKENSMDVVIKAISPEPENEKTAATETIGSQTQTTET